MLTAQQMPPSGTLEIFASYQGTSSSARSLRGEASDTLEQTLPSTPATAVFTQQFAVMFPSPLGRKEIRQTLNSTPVASALVSRLEKASEDGLLSHSELTQLFMKSCLRKIWQYR